MDHKAKAGTFLRNDSLKREVTFWYIMQQMRQEMALAWEDFFEKNPDKREQHVWQRIEERLRSKQSSKDQNVAAPAKSSLLEKGNANGSEQAYALRRREKIASLILKRRIWWESVPGVGSYVVYMGKERAIFEPDHFSWETTPGIISKLVIGKTALVIPEEWPEFPTESGTYYIGITSRDDLGNQSDPLLLTGVFKFYAPPAPLRGGIECL